MLAKILKSNKTLDEKIDDLRRFSATRGFLDALACSSDHALREVVAFAREVFAQYPPDSEFQLGPANDRRVFMIRLLTRLNYCNYCCTPGDAGVGTELTRLVYDLLTRENIFNRYLALKILYPLLRLPVPLDFALHLKLIGTFFHNELPQSNVDDPSKCELGFFVISEVLKYLRRFQLTYVLAASSYEGIFSTLAATLHTYLRPHGLLDAHADNKKIMCEYCSAAIRILEFVNIFSTAHTFYECVPDLCSTLAFRCPPDCYSLRRDAARAIVDTFAARPELFGSIEKYFARSAFTSTRYVPLQICLLDALSETVALFVRVDRGTAFERDAPARTDMLYKRAARGRPSVLSKIVFSEFDARISEYLPRDNSPLLLRACLDAYITNLSLLRVCTMTPAELRTAVVRSLRHAYRVYQLAHKEPAAPPGGACANDMLARDMLEGAQAPSMAVLVAKLVEYVSLVLQVLPMLHLPSGVLELEDLAILSRFVLLPLHDYSAYRVAGGKDTVTDKVTDKVADTGADTGAYYRLFFGLPLDDFDYIMRSCAGAILTRHYEKAALWGVLTENFVANVTLIRTANRLVHRDFVYGNYKHLEFYRHVFPVAYSFFKLDKKYFKSDFTELFNVTYQCALEMGLAEGRARLGTKDVCEILNSMFLAIKACESAYTGLYFIYNNFEKSISELYDLYALTNDLFYIECLFNIPVSLNLLVTKYGLLIRPMEVALRSTARLKEIVMKYIEYIIEFDNVSGMMDGLLVEVYKLLRYDDLKGMRVLSRISNIHRAALARDAVEVARLRDSYRITVPWEVRIAGREVEDEHAKRAADGADALVLQVNISLDTSMNSLVRGYIGCSFEHSFMHIRNSGALETLCTRTVSVVEPVHAVQEPARMYLLRYLLGMLGYGEYLQGTASPPEEESTRGYVLDDMFVLSRRAEGGLSYHAQYYVSVGDILLALYMDGVELVGRVLAGFMRSYVGYVLASRQQTSSGYRVFVSVLVDAFVYAPERAREMVLLFYRLLDAECRAGALRLRELKNKFVCERVHEMVDLVYLEDDLKSVRALQAIRFYVETAGFHVDDRVCPAVMYALRYKLLRTRTHRMYELCADLAAVLFRKFELRAREHYERVFGRDGDGDGAQAASYVRLLHCELEFMFGLNPLSDLPQELDRRSALRILRLPRHMLEKYGSLVALTENLLKIIERADAHAVGVYSAFISRMGCESARFNELLAPAKKYLPTVAVMEGFSSLESKHKFVETVNRNGHLQNSNPNSFRVFRNLFFNCQLAAAIKTNFIETYNNQAYGNESRYVSVEYRAVIYDILLHSREYDIVTLDFLLTKAADVAAGDCGGILRTIYARISEAGDAGALPADACRYLVEHMHMHYVCRLVGAFVPFEAISAHLVQWLTEYYYAAAAASLPNFADRMVQSKRAYYILRYMQANGYRFENNRLVLLVYRDMHSDYPGAVDLINWYFAGFSADEVDLLYRIDPSAVVDSDALLDKISAVEHEYLRVWLLYSLERRAHPRARGFVPVRAVVAPRVPRPAAAPCRDDSSDSSCAESLFVDDSGSELSQSLSYEPSLSEVSLGGSEDTHEQADAGAGAGADTHEQADEETSTHAPRSSHAPPPLPAAAPDVGALVGKVAPLPLVKFFIRTGRRDERVVSLCRSCLDNTALRYAALHYLCMFDPRPEYAPLVFKLNFQERIYAVDSLLLLLDRFGAEVLIPTVKTVIRSEMRFMTSKHVLLPLIILRPALVDNDELFFELCVMAYRLFSRMMVDYDLLALIERRARGATPDSMLVELNTLVVLHELKHVSFRIFHGCRDFAFDRALAEVAKMGGDRHGERVGAVFAYVRRSLDSPAVLRCRGELLALFLANPGTELASETIAWLFNVHAAGGAMRISTSNIMCMVDEGGAPVDYDSMAVFLGSTAANQMGLLELLLQVDPQAPLAFDLLKELARRRYPHADRLAAALAVLVGAIPAQLAAWMLSDGAAAGCPVLAEYVADLIPRVDATTAVSLCLLRFCGKPADGARLDAAYATNYLHLFKHYASALPLRAEFYRGCSSRNRVLRHSYMNLFYSQMPVDAYGAVEFVLRNDWRDVPSNTVEFMTAIAFLRVLKLTNGDQRYAVPDWSASGSALLADLSYIYRPAFQDSFDSLVDMFYFCSNSASFVKNFLLVVFRLLNRRSLERLYVLFLASNVATRVGSCFVQAFDSRDISCGGIYFNPYNPTMRFYSNVGDRAMYYGMVKSLPALRETKMVAKLSLLGRHEQALAKIYEVFRGVEKRTVSYKKQDMRILEHELRYIYSEYDMGAARGADGFRGVAVARGAKGAGRSAPGTPTAAPPCTPSPAPAQHDSIYALYDETHCFYSTFTDQSTIEGINQRFCMLISRITQTEDVLPVREEICSAVNDLKSSLYIMCYIPRSSRVFSRLLMYAAVCSEISEALLILRDGHNDSIYGRFRMWMVRYPSFVADLVDWSQFMQWRTYIFNCALSYVSESDKKKISAELCKLTYLYASRAFREKLYGRTSYILNSINGMATIELQQNIQKYMLDIEALFASGEYGTVVSLVNSINVNRLSGEDKSRLYHWASRAFARLHKTHEAEKFGALSRKIADIVENKREYLRMLRELVESGADGAPAPGCPSLSCPALGAEPCGGGMPAAMPPDAGTPPPSAGNMQALRHVYAGKLVEIINELPVGEARAYVIDFIENGELGRVEQIQPEKLYFFIPQLGRCADHLMGSVLVRTSFSSARVFEWLHRRQSSRWAEYHGLRRRLAERLDAGGDDCTACDIDRLFDMELRHSFEINHAALIMHTFEHPTALPGQFSRLRSEYENIKVMCYVEDFYSAHDEAVGIFFVRNTDGSISKVQLHEGAGDKDGCAPAVAGQLAELLSWSMRCHALERAGFDVPAISRMGRVTVHDKAYFSMDSAIKLQLFRKHLGYSSVALECQKVRRGRHAELARAALRWQDLLRRELVERLVASSDFYMFRSKFVNSYSSIIAMQHLLGTCDISLGRTFIEEVSGRVLVAGGDECAAERFYMRPNVGYMFGNEGKNGPLVLILSRFAEAYLGSPGNASIVRFFLGKDRALECAKRISRLVFDGLDEGCNSAELAIGEMADPRTGLSVRLSEMAWI